MTNSIAKKIAAATLALSALAGTSALALTAAVGTTVAVSAITAEPASAANKCKKTSITKTVNPRLHTRGGQRRGLRRAKKQWKSEVNKRFGSNFNNLSKAEVAIDECQLKSGKMVCTIKAKPCG